MTKGSQGVGKGWSGGGAYWEVMLLPMQCMVQPSALQQVHNLPLLGATHAGKHRHAAHDCLHRQLICLLQHLLKGTSCHAALGQPL